MAKSYFLLTGLFTLHLLSSNALARGIIERRIWIETGVKETALAQCKDSMKQWRCILTERAQCETGMVELSKACGSNLLADIPEYIDSGETEAQAQKVVVDCLTVEFTKKHIINLSKEKLDEYNVCTGAVARSKPLAPGLTKAMDFSKTQLVFSCAADGFIRKCYSLGESECKGLLEKTQLDCTMRMEAEGNKGGKDDAAILETGKQITDCTLFDAKKGLAANKQKSKHKDCN